MPETPTPSRSASPAAFGGIRGQAPGRGRLKGRRILIVGGGQRIFDAATDPIGNGRAMSILCASEGAHVAVADINKTSADHTVDAHHDGGRPRLHHRSRCHQGE